MQIIVRHLQLHFIVDAETGRGYVADMHPGVDKRGRPEPRIDWIPIAGVPALQETRDAEIKQLSVILQTFLTGGYEMLKTLDDGARAETKLAIIGKV